MGFVISRIAAITVLPRNSIPVAKLSYSLGKNIPVYIFHQMYIHIPNIHVLIAQYIVLYASTQARIDTDTSGRTTASGRQMLAIGYALTLPEAGEQS